MNNMKTVEVIATGASLEVNLGFLPSKVEIVNVTNGVEAKWNSSMDTGEFLKMMLTTLSGDAQANPRTLETTNGIAHTTQGVAGVAQTTAKGITIGAADDINDTEGEVLCVHAWE